MCVICCFLLLSALAVCNVQSENLDPLAPQARQCNSVDQQDCNADLCTWTTEQGAVYNLDALRSKEVQVALQSPQGSIIKLILCPRAGAIICQNRRVQACLLVPGVQPTSAGATLRAEQMEPNVPAQGLKLFLEDGEICELTRRPRRTIVTIPCDPSGVAGPGSEELVARKGWEGQKSDVCNYFVEFGGHKLGCPVVRGGNLLTSHKPQIRAVTGCVDSEPKRKTSECFFSKGNTISLHGFGFDTLCSTNTPHPPSLPTPPTTTPSQQLQPSIADTAVLCTVHVRSSYRIMVGNHECKDPVVMSEYQINCTLEKGMGQGLAVSIVEAGDGRRTVAVMEDALSFKEAIDFRSKFDKFVELGVGGLKKEINELYRRAFASRGTSPDTLRQLGISHVKGILLYGPPGAGKTLLARTVAKILGSKQVQLINGPEIVSKYLGESERNLRTYFKDAQDAWQQHGDLSDLYVIIIDEIDAICKPRGKTDQSAAGAAYDALVNQLLTLMDGLSEMNNLLVVGMTNRRELMDSALLRPGRFEVQIEVGLPDEEGRREIFEIHTGLMAASGMLGPDVNLRELAANTTSFNGAEIAGVVRAAASFALERYESGRGEAIRLAARDFQRAIKEVLPTYTHTESQILANYVPQGFLPCGTTHGGVVDDGLDLIHAFQHSTTLRLQSILLYGPKGSGKTTLASHLALLGKFSLVKIMTASSLIGHNDVFKVDHLHQVFEDASKSPSAVIVLDDLHRLVECIQVASQITVSHILMHTITTLLTARPHTGAKILVLGTMTLDDGKILDDQSALNLPSLFMAHLKVPLLDVKGILTFLAAKNIHRVGGGQLSLPANLRMSLSQLVYSVECVCAESQAACNGTSPAYVRQDQFLDCITSYAGSGTTRLDQ